MDGFSPSDGGGGIRSPNPMFDDPFLSALMNSEGYPELFSPSQRTQIFSALGDSDAHQMLDTWPSFSYLGSKEKMASQHTTMESGSLVNSSGMEGTIKNSNLVHLDDTSEQQASIVPMPITGFSFTERMLKALSLFKETSGGGILAQVWMPIKQGDHTMLTTTEQPYLLDQILVGYREISRHFMFSAKDAPGLPPPGLPGRVFISGMPEWTSNVAHYHPPEYLRMEYALSHEVRGSLAVPVFDPSEGSCCAVLELVTKREKSDFDAEMDSVCNALQAVDLKTTKVRAYQQPLTTNQISACTEILDVLRAICHAHMLPLALTWVPVRYNDNITHSSRTVLCIQESACYVNDPSINGFLHACTEHHLEKGQGVAGQALRSNHPFFSSDVRDYNIQEYPLAHHARKFGLRAAIAIRLRSTHTGHDDYILELFLPVKCRCSEEQQLLLNNLSSTMQRICKSLRTVSDSEIAGSNVFTNETALRSRNIKTRENREATDSKKAKSNSICPEKKHSRPEKSISLGVLRRYFSGSLKAAADSLGVCPTTLKRICRQHGISRWPSRKINKVNRSLEKIQNVISLVQGVDEALKYDPGTGHLVAVAPPKTKGGLLAGPDPDALIKEAGCQGDDQGLDEQNCASSSGVADSSSGCASSHPAFKKRLNHDPKAKRGPHLTVKATYRGDTVRFKLLPSMDWHSLLSEIAKRFKLAAGSFQLKYLDDEEDWVMLASDSDLQECIHVSESIGSPPSVRVQVRDLPCVNSSSASGNSLSM